ncbi:MAG: flavin reductase family protein, partial [Lachnospiraceae bacterium]|nr:flavin reductase family protein [Lachnospiraceae bacterium]
FHVNYNGDTPFIDEGNLVLICKKLSATRMTADQFIDPKLADAFYKDGDMHTMYVGEITQILAR